MSKAISEFVGRADLVRGGGDTAVYRALKRLLCAACGGVIEEGGLFTRERLGGRGPRVVPRCRECAPFQSRPEAGPGRSDLIADLLSPAAEVAPETRDRGQEATDMAIEERLGPALRWGRKGRFG